MSAPTQAGSDSERRSSLSESEEDIPIDLMDEALMIFGAGLPPFIQKNLDPTIVPGDKHQVIPKTNTGTIPSVKSIKRVQLVCRAWNSNNSDRFWTYDCGNVRYIVKAFRTHAQPRHIPKIAYHVWLGMGGQNRFQTTQIAFDADDRLYGPDTREKFIPLGFGTIDTNKELRIYADYLDHMLDGSIRSSLRRKSVSNLCMKTFFDHDFSRFDNDERPMRRTRSMMQKAAYDHTHIPPIPLKFNSSTNIGGGTHNNKLRGLRARLTGRRVVTKTGPSDANLDSQSGPPKAVTKYQKECSRDSVPFYRNKPKILSQDPDNEKADGISYHVKSSKALNPQSTSETDRISNRKSIYPIWAIKPVKRQDKSETDNTKRENSRPSEDLYGRRWFERAENLVIV